MKYLKVVLFTFNLLIWLAGCTVLVIGAWLLLEPSKGHLLNLFVPDATPHETINLIAYSLLGLGFTVLTVGCFGCRAALHGNQCILATYMSMLVALIVTELVTAAVGGLMTCRILSGLEERLVSKLADDYGHEPTSDIPFSHSLDFAQYKFNCCGIHGYGDYNGTAWWRDAQISGNRRQVPLTCCVLKNTEMKNTGSPMSVVSRVFNKNTAKPWLNPKPKDETACQVEDEEGHDGYRHKEGCLGKVTSWLQYESFTLVFLGMAMAGIQGHANGLRRHPAPNARHAKKSNFRFPVGLARRSGTLFSIFIRNERTRLDRGNNDANAAMARRRDYFRKRPTGLLASPCYFEGCSATARSSL